MRNSRALPGLALACLLAVVEHPGAQSVSVSTRKREIPEAGSVTEVVVRAKELEFMFVPPGTWKRHAESGGLRWHWTSRDMTAVLGLIVRPETNRSPRLAQANVLRQELVNRYPSARLVEEFPCYTSGEKGLAFDLEESVDEKLKRAIRVAHVPLPGAVAEFTLVTSTTALARHGHALTGLMNSFRVAGPSRP